MMRKTISFDDYDDLFIICRRCRFCCEFCLGAAAYLCVAAAAVVGENAPPSCWAAANRTHSSDRTRESTIRMHNVAKYRTPNHAVKCENSHIVIQRCERTKNVRTKPHIAPAVRRRRRRDNLSAEFKGPRPTTGSWLNTEKSKSYPICLFSATEVK